MDSPLFAFVLIDWFFEASWAAPGRRVSFNAILSSPPAGIVLNRQLFVCYGDTSSDVRLLIRIYGRRFVAVVPFDFPMICDGQVKGENKGILRNAITSARTLYTVIVRTLMTGSRPAGLPDLLDLLSWSHRILIDITIASSFLS